MSTWDMNTTATLAAPCITHTRFCHKPNPCFSSSPTLAKEKCLTKKNKKRTHFLDLIKAG